jgi:hypothetical protein
MAKETKEYRIAVQHCEKLQQKIYQSMLEAMSGARELSIDLQKNVCVYKITNGERILLATFSVQ